ncbi:hypothetical protein [Phaeobacter piscinae]|uniref:hypothetical protein n=1 Tax=Phaeobacter piscinae TaxID=1580596 RepID=UPI001038CE05|nr:hypothetical protein [Phaeobacter piscinae]UTS81659.1 hypothetical protein OL67_002745 [Phaeobacter piscinae]
MEDLLDKIRAFSLGDQGTMSDTCGRTRPTRSLPWVAQLACSTENSSKPLLVEARIIFALLTYTLDNSLQHAAGVCLQLPFGWEIMGGVRIDNCPKATANNW